VANKDYTQLTAAAGANAADTDIIPGIDKSDTADGAGGSTRKFTRQQIRASDAETKAAYEANADTNAFSDAEQAKLAGVEASATADQTGAEIKAAYEGEADTNAFSDAEQAKLTAAPDFSAIPLLGGTPADADHVLLYDASAGAWKYETMANGVPYRDDAAVISAIEGAVGTLAKRIYNASAAPTSGDDTGSGYEPGSIWVDTTNDKAYVCLDATAAAAVWLEITASGAAAPTEIVIPNGGTDQILTFDPKLPIWSASAAGTFSAISILTRTATSGSDGSNYLNFYVKNETTGLSLYSADWSSNGDELTANTWKNTGADQNLAFSAGDIISYGFWRTGTITGGTLRGWLIKFNVTWS
jgi:hypothetical protein